MTCTISKRTGWAVKMTPPTCVPYVHPVTEEDDAMASGSRICRYDHCVSEAQYIERDMNRSRVYDLDICVHHARIVERYIATHPSTSIVLLGVGAGGPSHANRDAV